MLELVHDVKLLLLYKTYLWQVDKKRYTLNDKDRGGAQGSASLSGDEAYR